MGKISTSLKYVIDTTGLNLLSLWGVGGGGVDSKKLEKLRYFNLGSGDWILMKFDI